MTWYLYLGLAGPYWSMQAPCYVKDPMLASRVSERCPSLADIADGSPVQRYFGSPAGRGGDGGITAHEQYRRKWDDAKIRASAVHDWASHPADAGLW
jgi:hypothetical protein